MRSGRVIFLIAIAIFLPLSVSNLMAQSEDALGTFTPYSIFGVGDIERGGTPFNKAMGGIGIGIRDNRVINILNPASINDRDSLSFLLDFGVNQKNILSKTNNHNSAYNTFNMNHLIMSFPLFNNSAFAIGVTPYSWVGYNFEANETDPSIINEMGDITYRRYGEGGITKAFLSASVALSKNFSVGAEAIYYFGNIDRHSDIIFNSNTTYRTINSGTDYVVGSFAAKFGAQYSANIGEELSFTAGATWTMGTKLSGDNTRYAFTLNESGRRDTTYLNTMKGTMMEVPSELGMGLSLRKKDKWLIGVDYLRQDWSNAAFASTPGVDFSTTMSSSIRAGFEYIPNRYDIRYYSRRITYRGGVYYENTYMKLNGEQISSMGITLGATLPILRFYNGVGFSIDVGQRGALKNNLVKENYVMFNLSLSLHDLWFIKFRYD